MPVVGNRIKVSSSSTGTGNIVLGSADAGFQTFADGGIQNNDVVRYTIIEGSNFEIATGTFLTSGPTLQRSSSNLLESSTGSLLNLGGSATVFVTLADVDIMQTSGGTFTDDVTFTGANYNVVWDKSDDAFEFADNAKLKFGASDDLEVYHQSSDGRNYIDSGSNELRISATSSVSIKNGFEEMAVFTPNAAVSLYHDNQPKFSTSSTGVTVTGTLAATAVTGDGSGLTNLPAQTDSTKMPLAGGTFTGDVVFDGDSADIIFDKSHDALAFRQAAALKFVSTSATNQQSRIQWDGTRTHWETFNNSRVEFDGDFRFVNSTGVDVTGTVTAAGFSGSGANLTNVNAATGGGTDKVFYENDQTVTTNYTITNGKSAMSAGPITISNGVTVTVGDGESYTVV